MSQKKKVNSIDDNVRKIQQQSNGSITIVLPPELLRELKWKPKMSVVVKKRGEGILLEKVVKQPKASTPKAVKKVAKTVVKKAVKKATKKVTKKK